MTLDRPEEIARTNLYKNASKEDQAMLDNLFRIEGMSIQKLYEYLGKAEPKKENSNKTTSENRFARFYEKTNVSIDELLLRKAENTSAKGTKTGLNFIDANLSFNKKTFNFIQAMSNHGKTTLMTNLVCRFLEENKDDQPYIVFLPLETAQEEIATLLMNVYACIYLDKKPVIGLREQLEKYYPKNQKFKEIKEGEKLVYPEGDNSFPKAKKWYDAQKENLKIFDEERNIEFITSLMEEIQQTKKDRTVIFIVDYVQLIDSEIANNQQAHHLIKKDIAYDLVEKAKEYGQIVIATSQINDDRVASESSSIKNAATVIIDVMKNDHPDLLYKNQYKKLHSEQIIHPKYKDYPNTIMASPCTVSILKNRTMKGTYHPKPFHYNFAMDGFVF